MSIDLFQRRVDECRRLATAATTPSDKAFWLGLVERWQALEARTMLRNVQVSPAHRSGDKLNCQPKAELD